MAKVGRSSDGLCCKINEEYSISTDDTTGPHQLCADRGFHENRQYLCELAFGS